MKNLGESAIDNILEVREEAGGKFANFADFISRVNLKTVNKRALETLIYAGAFDCIHSNRRQLLEGLDLMVSWVQKRLKEKETGQLNIFEQMMGNSTNTATETTTEISYESAPRLPRVEDFSPKKN